MIQERLEQVFNIFSRKTPEKRIHNIWNANVWKIKYYVDVLSILWISTLMPKKGV